MRIQEHAHAFNIISKDGLTIEVVLSIRFHPKVELLGVLHQEVGPDYLNLIVIPEVQALARSTFGAYTPEEMYPTKRTLIEETLSRATSQVSERYVVLDDLLVKEIKLPPLIKTSIEKKRVEQQNALAMSFRIQREEQEVVRKIIEAGGTAKANALLHPTLNEDLLRYRGIDATLQLASSNNAKVIVIGNNDGLPLILDPSKITPDSPSTKTTPSTTSLVEPKPPESDPSGTADKTPSPAPAPSGVAGISIAP